MRMKLWLQGIFWIFVYILLTAAPLLILLIGPVPEGREFWRELSAALGYAGLAMMAIQFALTARFKIVKAPYGADIVYHFHRQISFVALLLILAHPLLLFIYSPDTLQLLNPISAPWRARAGVIALLALIVMIAASVWRQRLKFEYTQWRIWHGILATLAVILAMTHVVLAGHYINTPIKQALWLSGSVFWVGMLAYVRIIKPILLLYYPYQVDSVKQERGKAWTLAVKPVGHAGMRFMPGQFAWLTAWSSPFSDREHPFSISSSASNPEKIEFTIKELGDFTSTIKEMEPGQKVYLDGPFGAFSVDRHPHAKGYNFIAGGIGITPFMSMLRTLKDRNDKRPLLLIYANNRWEDITFREGIEALQKSLNLKVVHVLANPPEGWQGERGFVTAEILERYLPEERQTNVYETFICGPPPMMDAIERTLPKLGISLGDFHSERFNLV
ncbi:MAG: ferric reductase-like transmembrane domain-containing protein [Anaerolineae bacterium]|nr:ferric reductase-like transmembrane domain-containing protein [Anaerolineae bacterium]